MTIPKKIKYEKERIELLNKIYHILNIEGYNRLVLNEQLTDNQEVIDKMLDLIDDVKRYFSSGRWVYFNTAHLNKSLIVLVKNILKDMNVDFNVIYMMDDNNKSIRKKGFYIHR